MFYAQKLFCPECGANVCFSMDGKATCMFCLSSFDVPEEIENRRIQNQEIEKQLLNTTAKLKAAEALDPKDWAIYLVASIQAILFLCSIPFFVQRGLFNSSIGTINTLMFGAFAIVPVVLFFSHLRKKRKMAESKLSLLPPAEIRLDNTLRLACPECGAVVIPSKNSLSLTCRHCQTESLMPIGLQDSAMGKKQKRIALLRKQKDTIERDIASHFETSNHTGAILSIGIGLVFGIGLSLLVLIISPEKRSTAIIAPFVFGGLPINFGLVVLLRGSQIRHLLVGFGYVFFGFGVFSLLLNIYPLKEVLPALVVIGLIVFGFGFYTLYRGIVNRPFQWRGMYFVCLECNRRIYNSFATSCPHCGYNWWKTAFGLDKKKN